MKIRHDFGKNNKGAALVMAIVVIAFVSILTTILLYLANMNYQMKATDYNTKVSFYGAEMPLEEIRTALVMDATIATKNAYDNTVILFSNKTDAEREVHYQNLFYDSFMKTWKTERTNDMSTPAVDGWEWEYGIKENVLKYIPSIQADCHVLKSDKWVDNKCDSTTCTCSYHILLDNSLSDSSRLHKEVVPGTVPEEKRLVLDGIKVIYTKNEFTSIIETSFIISPPKIDWSVDEFDDTNPGATVEREDIAFQTYVTYMGYKKE